MTDDNRKLLTEYLGICWHTGNQSSAVGRVRMTGGIILQKCTKCGKIMSDSFHIISENRTFATPDDFFALKDKLVEKGDWGQFIAFAELVRLCDNCIEWIDWLINPANFCELVAEWLKRRGDK